jgi:hypothetical protein
LFYPGTVRGDLRLLLDATHEDVIVGFEIVFDTPRPDDTNLSETDRRAIIEHTLSRRKELVTDRVATAGGTCDPSGRFSQILSCHARADQIIAIIQERAGEDTGIIEVRLPQPTPESERQRQADGCPELNPIHRWLAE